jgi:tetratricopeptide (TPR) repeat protein
MGMSKEMDSGFQFTPPQMPRGPLVEMSAREMEALLLQRLEEERSRPQDALWQLARFYQQTGQCEKGFACLRKVLAQMDGPEPKASCLLAMGQMMESADDYPSAVRFYKEALALEPVQTDVWYFINNNLGYSLNRLGNFIEGERYCRKAIAINPARENGFKNLGLALAGQARFQEAARCFVAATRMNAADPRSCALLQDLLNTHTDLAGEFQADLESCRKAVENAAKRAQAFQPVVYRGWKKRLVMAWARVRWFFRRWLNNP